MVGIESPKRRIAMSDLHATYLFKEGHLIKAEPPEWFAKPKKMAIGQLC
jgi:hypothetical protein